MSYRAKPRVSPRKRPYKAFFKLCHCEKRLCLSRRGNPPKGFLSSKVICGNDDVTVIVIQCHCRRQCLKNTPAAPLPRPPTPHGQGHTLSVVVATGINNVIGNRQFRAFCNYVNPPPARSAATRRRRISSCVARFHLPTGKSRCAYFFVRARGGWSGKGAAWVFF